MSNNSKNESVVNPDQADNDAIKQKKAKPFYKEPLILTAISLLVLAIVLISLWLANLTKTAQPNPTESNQTLTKPIEPQPQVKLDTPVPSPTEKSQPFPRKLSCLPPHHGRP